MAETDMKLLSERAAMLGHTASWKGLFLCFLMAVR